MKMYRLNRIYALSHLYVVMNECISHIAVMAVVNVYATSSTTENLSRLVGVLHSLIMASHVFVPEMRC